MISPFGRVGLPLTSRVGGRWALGVICLLITSDADYIIATQVLNSDFRERLEKYKSIELEMFLSNVVGNPPDVVIVDDVWARRHFDYPQVRSWLKGYRLLASAPYIFYSFARDQDLQDSTSALYTRLGAGQDSAATVANRLSLRPDLNGQPISGAMPPSAKVAISPAATEAQAEMRSPRALRSTATHLSLAAT